MADDGIAPGKKLYKELVHPGTGRVILQAGTVLTEPQIKTAKQAGLLEQLAACIDSRVIHSDLDGFEIEVPELPGYLADFERAVVVTLPPPPVDPPPAPAPVPTGPKALVVDDAMFMRATIVKMLSSAGFVCVEAADGREAIDRFAAERPDVVTLDITMPGIDGLATLQAIRQIDPGALVVMCTSVGHSDVVQRAIQLGARGYLKKPIAPATLLQTMRDLGLAVTTG